MIAAKILQRAAEVVARSGPDRPADGVLREAMTEWRTLTPPEKRTLARAVFASFRWFAWLDPNDAPAARVAAALDLQARHDENPVAFKPEALAARAVPAWVHDEVNFTPDDLRALQREPRLWVRARQGHIRAVARALSPHYVAPPPAQTTGLAYAGDTDLFRTEEFKKGWFEIQDLGSQLVGHACAPQPGEIWWDACAGEGGKTLHLADLLQNKGLIWATDRSNRRLERLKQRTARAQAFNYRAVNWNGGPFLPTKTLFDGILVDAPCSGVGTWRRNPHARWTCSLTDVQELAGLQRQLLEHVAGSLKPGGRLIYAVCTLTRTETTAVADAFSAAHPELEPLPLLDRGPQTTLGLAEWDANGMFVAGWRRVSA